VGDDVGRLLELCQEALARDPEGRRAYLDEACADTDVRRAVEALLAEESAAREFLETPAWSAGRSQLAAGLHLGPYEILSLVGAGAMGQVYRARDERLGRTVAIKVLAPSAAGDPGRRARFNQEARAVSALNHPHICTLHDIGSENGLDYLVMEYLEGETLADRLTKGPVPLDLALAYSIQMAEALASAHAQGLIHRDLKPANVMLTAAGAKLLDFSIAKLGVRGTEPSQTSLTGEGLIVGTIAYMAPEQLRGRAADARTDIFSFGAVLYELFTGRRAFQGRSQTSVIAAILEHDPPPVSSLQPACPPAIDRLVRTCLHKSADQRWQQADDIVRELRLVSSGSTQNRPATPRGWPAGRASRAGLLTGIAIAIAAVGIAVRETASRLDQDDLRNAASGSAAADGARAADVILTAVTHEPGPESFPSLSPDGREFVYSVGPLDSFGESDIYRRDVGLDRAFNLTPDSPGADLQPAFSPDGNLIAFRSDRGGGGIFLMRRDGTAVRRLTHEGYNPAWSPDGTEIAYATVHTMASPFTNVGTASALWVVNVETGASRLVRPSGAAQPSWSPHGNRIAFWADRAISTCVPDGSDVVVAVEAAIPGMSNWNPVWSRDGRQLYFISNRNGPMHLWRVRIDERSGRPLDHPELAPVQMPSTFVAHPSFDASGQRLLFASVPPVASIQRMEFDVASGGVRGDLTPVTTGSVRAVWPEPSPDGMRLAFQTKDDTENIYVSSIDGSGLRLLTGGAGVNRIARWAPNGRRIAFYSSRGGYGNVWVVDADGGHLRQLTQSRGAPIIFPAWSPDGRMAASEAQPGSRSFVFDPDKPWNEVSNLAMLPRPDPDTQFVPWSWSPTGDRLAGFGRPIVPGSAVASPGVLILTLSTGRYTRVTADGTAPTPVWLPDGHRIVYAVSNRVKLVDLRSGRTRELLNVGAARLEAAAGGGFSVSAAAGLLFVAPLMRDGDIWFARPKAN
jgi:serine/threonine protein kinase/Tol biopolymer transport system component